jgi:glucose/arabinose dehydrogenase
MLAAVVRVWVDVRRPTGGVASPSPFVRGLFLALPATMIAWPSSIRGLLLGVVAAAATGCAENAGLPETAGIGPHPALPEPTSSLLPVINVVDAVGWVPNQTPTSVEGTVVTAFARGLDHPRWSHVLPHGDVLVAETNAPPRPDDSTGIRGWFFKRYQRKAGGAVPGANRFVPFSQGQPAGMPVEVLTDFVPGDGRAMGRPVGVAIDRRGGLLVADDVGNAVWRVAAASAAN